MNQEKQNFEHAADTGTPVTLFSQQYKLVHVKDGETVKGRHGKRTILTNLRKNLFWAHPLNNGKAILICSDDV